MKDRPHVILFWVVVGALTLVAIMLAAPAFAAVAGEWRVNLIRGSSGTFATLRAQTQEEAWRLCGYLIAAQPPSATTWTCQTPRYVARVEPDPTPTCDPLPDPVTEQRQCPEGTVGTWPQTQAYIREPYPLCQSAGPWVPVEPPSGACTVPPPPPPPTGEWTHCANQNERCAFTGTRTVRYGAIDENGVERFEQRDFTGGMVCNNAGFGMNPAPDLLKTCSIRSAVTPPPPPTEPPPTGTGAALLDWRPPLQNVDDTPADLTGFRVRYGRSADSLNQVAEVGPVTTYTVTGLATGSWLFAVSALSASGESEQSNVAAKVVQ
jgi:hypothetical protein